MFGNYINTDLGYDIIINDFLDVEIIKNSVCIYDANLKDYQDKWNFSCSLALDITEANKNMDTIFLIVDFLLNNNINRDIVIYAIGGGVTLDLVNFAASIYKRGVKVINVPTTVLAQVDASIGGKCGVNYKNTKNLLGVIKQPYKVIIDPKFLKTLSQRHYNNGIAEVIKYGCIYDEKIIDMLLCDSYDINTILQKSIEAKIYFVKNDVNDLGIRQYLNFGHTYAHAIESYYNYEKYLHGEAVSIGMNLKFKNEKLKLVCEKFDLPTTIETEVLKKLDMSNDKKNTAGKINFINVLDFGVLDELKH